MRCFCDLKNKIDFFIRSSMRFSRKGFFIKNEAKDDLFDDFYDESPVRIKEAKLFKKYDLFELKNNSTKRNYLENLYIIELLEKYSMPLIEKADFNVIDIGSKNWFYAAAQYSFFKKFTQNLFLSGIELDAFRVYTSFHSRFDAAMFYIKNLKNTKYIAGDFLKNEGEYDYICCFFPFIVEEPLLRWGLPLDCFKPNVIFAHAYNSLAPGGEMLILNQGDEEYSIQHKILDELKIPYEPRGKFESVFLEYKHKRYVTLIKKMQA